MIISKDKNIVLRKFRLEDVAQKVEWINNPSNNTYLHYDLPLEYDKTEIWFNKVKDLNTRLDLVIEYNNVPVGLIGLLSIDSINKKAEYYICMGEHKFKGCGIATNASIQLFAYAFNDLQLNRIFLYTEKENIPAQKLFEKLGFVQEGLIKHDLIYNGRTVDRYIYRMLKEEFKNAVCNPNK